MVAAAEAARAFTAMRNTASVLQGGSVPEGRAAGGQTTPMSNHHEIHLKVLREIEENPSITQRELADRLDVSLGKANYCLKALIDKGYIKARNFHNSNNKRAYLYKLTPHGIEEKARITVAFLRRKMHEYEQLKEEIDELQLEVNNNGLGEPEN